MACLLAGCAARLADRPVATTPYDGDLRELRASECRAAGRLYIYGIGPYGACVE